MMGKESKFEDILNECLERLFVKGETVEECLGAYPELESELEPLLRTAMIAKGASVVTPRPEFKARARYQFQSALKGLPQKRGFSLFGWHSRWATALVSVLVVVLLGSSTVAAASGSMPDGALYPVKLATEEVWLAFTFSDEAKARVYAALADRRVEEIIDVANKGKTEEVEQTVELLSAHLASIPNLVSTGAMLAPAPEMAAEGPAVTAPAPAAPPAPREGGMLQEDAGNKSTAHSKLRATLMRNAADHPAALRAALENASPQVKQALLEAIQALEAAYGQALDAVED